MHKGWKIAIVILLAAVVVGAAATKNSKRPERNATQASRRAAEPKGLAAKPRTSVVRTQTSPPKRARAGATAAKPAKTRGARKSVGTTRSAGPPPKPRPKRASPASAGPSERMPRLVDLGASKCIPCRMMAPVLRELAEEYRGRLKVEFIDVWENREAALKYQIRVIPTQIFYDSRGNEFYRHEGFFSKQDILAKFQEKGINLNKEAKRQ